MWSRTHLPRSLLNNSEGEVMFNFFLGVTCFSPKTSNSRWLYKLQKNNDFGSLFGFATSSSHSQGMMLCNSLCTYLLFNNCCCSEVSQPRGTHFLHKFMLFVRIIGRYWTRINFQEALAAKLKSSFSSNLNYHHQSHQTLWVQKVLNLSQSITLSVFYSLC
jgi:hypothetical protein